MPTISVMCPSYETSKTLTLEEGYVYCSTTEEGTYSLCMNLISLATADSPWSVITNMLPMSYLDSSGATYYYYSFDFHITSSDTLFLKFQSGFENHNEAAH